MTSLRQVEVLYYTNGKGAVAISVDEGEHVVIPNGRVLMRAETVWEESGEPGPLSESQQRALQEAQDELGAMSDAESDLNDIVVAFRKRRMREEQLHPTRSPEKAHRRVSSSAMVEFSDLED